MPVVPLMYHASSDLYKSLPLDQIKVEVVIFPNLRL